ncbi:tyrosine-type recombinase/integrase [Corynebacterium sp. H127]|uniref:tyrosine-type recombinase/integrase n=1 Tax=Corynebacterium sp. H127 TaxID=3133418 RepID=UPI0030B7BCC7
MAKRARRSFGQIDELPSGKYRARYIGPDGRMHKAPQTFFTYDDAAGWLRREQKLIEFGEWAPPATRALTRDDKALTVGQWIEQWLTLREGDLEPSTLQDYRATIDRRILKVEGKAARLRDITVQSLRRRDVAEWWDAITAQFGHQVYNQHAYRRLKTAMNAAVDRDIIQLNPVALDMARKKVKATRKELPETEVMQSIVDEMQGPHKILAILTFFHGLRIGEAIALRRQDITVTSDAIIVHVRGTAYRKVGVGMVRKDTAKTEAAYRDVPIFHKFHHDIRQHLNAVGTAPDAILCPTAAGKLIMDTSYRTALSRAKTRAGHEGLKISPHYGRVWMNTALAEAGMTPVAIGQILGQTDLKTITEIYMRVSETHRMEGLAAVGEMLDASAASQMEEDTPSREEAFQFAGDIELVTSSDSGKIQTAAEEVFQLSDNVIDLASRRNQSRRSVT